MSQSDVKPCPFCGSAATMRDWDWPYTRWQVKCSGCKAVAPGARRASPENAITAWNTRAHPPAPAEVPGDLAERLHKLEYRFLNEAGGEYVGETIRAAICRLKDLQAREAVLVEGLEQIAETPNAGWMIARKLLNEVKS